ncbi:MAG: hypothetical protein INQ03_11890 [Candidatus Heimdallarchaeota archaeon]|nr:hypothetical protein [Candidatus Heimdallarchaeota archaeon]
MSKQSKTTKDYRMSFRISEQLYLKINSMIQQGLVRDKSELGIRAITHYISLLEESDEQTTQMKSAIIAMARAMNLTELPEIQILLDD